VTEPPGEETFDHHTRAETIYRRLRRFPELDDYDSRLLELIDYFGWEIGHKAAACRRWFYADDPALPGYLETLGLTYEQYAILHQYAAFNRLDPAREDMFYIYDWIAGRLDRIGGAPSVLDFGAGLGQIGLAFALDGYDVTLAEKAPERAAFARHLFRARRLEPQLYVASRDDDYFDTGSDGRRFGCVIEWSVLEHISSPRQCVETITAGLIRGGVLVTTTLAVEWTPELQAHYRRDADSAAICDQLFSDQLRAWIDERFEVVTPPRSLARLLVKR
jgi:SAM-dependent methyltransferase